MANIADTGADTEIDNIRTLFSDLIDDILKNALSKTVPLSPVPAALNHIVDILSHGEFEMRHGREREAAIRRLDFGWKRFDEFVSANYGARKPYIKRKIKGTAGLKYG